jgi:hypothetical protein
MSRLQNRTANKRLRGKTESRQALQARRKLNCHSNSLWLSKRSAILVMDFGRAAR